MSLVNIHLHTMIGSRIFGIVGLYEVSNFKVLLVFDHILICLGKSLYWNT